MTVQKSQAERGIEALRADLPDAARRDRVRARLVSAGATALSASALAASQSAASASAATGAAAAGTEAAAVGAGAGAAVAGAGTKVGVVAKLAALPLSAKVGSGALLALTTATALTVAPVPEAREPSRGMEAAAEAGTETETVTETVTETGTGTEAETGTVAVTEAETGTVTESESESGAGVGRQRREVVRRRALNSALAQEAMLLERALVALREGELGAARSLLAAHAARFPAGALVRERRQAEQRLHTMAAERPGGTDD